MGIVNECPRPYCKGSMVEDQDFDPSIGYTAPKVCSQCGRPDELDQARIRSLAKSKEMAALKRKGRAGSKGVSFRRKWSA